MALFKKTKKEEVVLKKTETKKSVAASSTTDVVTKNAKSNLSSVLKNPRITEKGAIISGINNVYPFDIDVRATKKDVAEAIKMIYKVIPVKIAVVTVPSKTVTSRKNGKKGNTSRGKKAYVYLKKGDKIEFV